MAWAIFGRKPSRRASSPTRTGRPRNDEYKAWIRNLPCAGMSMKSSDYSCVPLCTDCHTQAPGAYQRAGKTAFERERGLCFGELAERLNRAWRKTSA